MLCWFIICIGALGFSGLYYYLCQNLYLIPVWLIAGFLTSLIAFLLYVFLFIWLAPFSKPTFKLKHKLIHPIVVWVNTIMRLKIKVIGKENIPKETFVVYGNHKSMLDITIVYVIYHTVISAVAKKSLMKVPVLRRLIRALGAVSLDRENDREGVKNLLEAIGKVKNGLPFIIFPEGGIKTRDTDEMIALRAGAYKLAMKPRATISPISIVGSSKISSNAPFRKTKIIAIIHKPISYDEYQEYSTTELGMKVGTIINQGINTLKPNTLPLKDIEIVDFIRKETEDETEA